MSEIGHSVYCSSEPCFQDDSRERWKKSLKEGYTMRAYSIAVDGIPVYGSRPLWHYGDIAYFPEIDKVAMYTGTEYKGHGNAIQGWTIIDAKPELNASKQCRYDKIPYGHLQIKKVVFNAPATIVFWEDGTKTVVKCSENEPYDPEKGLMAAITKKALGNQGNYYNAIKKWLPEDEETTTIYADGEKIMSIVSKMGQVFEEGFKLPTEDEETKSE